MSAILKVNKVCKAYTDKNNRKQVLNNVSLEIEQNSIMGIVGPNGSGKTTLLKILSGLIAPDSGEVIFNDSESKTKVELLLEGARSFYWNLTGRENLDYFSTLFHISDSDQRIQDLVELLEMKDFINELSGNYSRGMQQKLSIAISLLELPDVLLLDEPTNGLDQDSIKKLISILNDLHKKYNLAILVVCHDLNFIKNFTKKVLFVRDGSIEKEIESHQIELYKKPVNLVLENYNQKKITTNSFRIPCEVTGKELRVSGDLYNLDFYKFMSSIDDEGLKIKEITFKEFDW